MAVNYVLADAYATNGIQGATTRYGDGSLFDILNALKNGGGDALGRGGSFSVSDPTLISALDSDQVVKRSGTSSPVAPTSAVAGPAYVALADSNGKYPSRPGVPTPVIWVGPNSPGNLAQDNDIWLNSTSTVTA